jgi:hypothetical protein
MNEFKYVVCCKDCNKHTPVIVACFATLNHCVTYLNKKGRKLSGNDMFNILDYEDEEIKEINGTEYTFCNVELFEFLYKMNGSAAYCTHLGQIHIIAIKKSGDMTAVYEFLNDIDS